MPPQLLVKSSLRRNHIEHVTSFGLCQPKATDEGQQPQVTQASCQLTGLGVVVDGQARGGVGRHQAQGSKWRAIKESVASEHCRKKRSRLYDVRRQAS